MKWRCFNIVVIDLDDKSKWESFTEKTTHGELEVLGAVIVELLRSVDFVGKKSR